MKNLTVNIIRFLVYILIFVLLLFAFTKVLGTIGYEHTLTIDMIGEGLGGMPLEIFYKSDGEDFSQDKSQGIYSEDTEHFGGSISVSVPDANTASLRLDFGENPGGKVTISSVRYRRFDKEMLLDPKAISALKLNDMSVSGIDGNSITLISDGKDPYIVIENFTFTGIDKTKSKIAALVLALVLTLIIWRFVHLKLIYLALKDLYEQRKLISSLAANDFKTRFAGSYFGIIWAFVQPICTILVFWFVFQIGFRNPNVGEVEYILWFMTGLIPWFFFSEAWNSATNAFMEYSYLVKKVVFKINILPLIKIISAFFIHIFFVVFMIVVYCFYGRFPDLYCLQLLYYMVCMLALVTALGFITAPLIIFFRDLGQIMNIILQFGMWLTPIMWSVDNLPSGMSLFAGIFKLNPMYYIVQGYRNSMIYKVMFYDNILQTAYFWTSILVLSVIGSIIYRRLKPHFADVL